MVLLAEGEVEFGDGRRVRAMVQIARKSRGGALVRVTLRLSAAN